MWWNLLGTVVILVAAFVSLVAAGVMVALVVFLRETRWRIDN